MAAAPQFKIYDEFKDYLGCMHDIYDAGLFCLNCGRKGFTIRKGHRIKDIIWTEPKLEGREIDHRGVADVEGISLHERKRLFNEMAPHQSPKSGGMPINLKAIETIEYTLPAYWATYLINGDFSGLEDGEQETIDAYIRAEGNPHFTDCGEQYFAHSNDATTLGGDVCDYTAYFSK